MAISKVSVRLQVTVDKETAGKINELAEKEKRTGSQMAKVLLLEAIAEREK